MQKTNVKRVIWQNLLMRSEYITRQQKDEKLEVYHFKLQADQPEYVLKIQRCTVGPRAGQVVNIFLYTDNDPRQLNSKAIKPIAAFLVNPPKPRPEAAPTVFHHQV
jgi:hypothetical protein